MEVFDGKKRYYLLMKVADVTEILDILENIDAQSSLKVGRYGEEKPGMWFVSTAIGMTKWKTLKKKLFEEEYMLIINNDEEDDILVIKQMEIGKI